MIECSICYQQRRHVVTLDCDHQFCKYCWSKWKNRELVFMQKKYPTCPLCRADQKPHKTYSAVHVIVFLLFVFWTCSREPPSPA
jgi:hypothetical protein